MNPPMGERPFAHSGHWATWEGDTLERIVTVLRRRRMQLLRLDGRPRSGWGATNPWTRARVAAKVGVKTSTLGVWERGTRGPANITELRAWCAALDMEFRWLIEPKDNGERWPLLATGAGAGAA